MRLTGIVVTSVSAHHLTTHAHGAWQECLTLHRGVVAEFLEAQFEPFFKRYNALLESTNYVTRRLSLKLLGELLLHAESKTVMVRISGTHQSPSILYPHLCPCMDTVAHTCGVVRVTTWV